MNPVGQLIPRRPSAQGRILRTSQSAAYGTADGVFRSPATKNARLAEQRRDAQRYLLGGRWSRISGPTWVIRERRPRQLQRYLLLRPPQVMRVADVVTVLNPWHEVTARPPVTSLNSSCVVTFA